MTDSQEYDVENKKPVFNNIPVHRPLIGRSWEIGKIESFLHANKPSPDRSYPPAIMVVHGPKGVGKTTLVREIAWRCVHSSKFTLILWFNHEKFTDLVIGDSSILPDPQEPGPQKGISEFLRELTLENNFSIMEIMERLWGGDQISEDVRPIYQDYLERLLKYKPFLLIVDDFDEGDMRNTRRLCLELERIRAPNKVILTSRINAFEFSEPVQECSVGLLNKEDTIDLSECDCDNSIPRYLWVNEDLEHTADWIWTVSGGLPHFITQFLLKEAKHHDRKLGLLSLWSSSFADYTIEYLSEDPGELFEKLDRIEKYILTTLATQEPLQVMEVQPLLEILGVVLDNEGQYTEFSEALIRLYQKRLLSCRIAPKQIHKPHKSLIWCWTLLPFMGEFIREKLTEYQTKHFYEERTQRWINFFEHYLANDVERVEPHFDRVLSVLSWCVEHAHWEPAIKLGRLVTRAMERLGYASDAHLGKQDKYLEACTKTIEAAREIRDLQTEIEQQLELISYAPTFRDFRDKIPDIFERYQEVEASGTNITEIERANVFYLYAKYQLVMGHGIEAKNRLEEAIVKYRNQGCWREVGWATLDLAELLFHLNQTSQAFLEAEKVKEIAPQVREQQIALELEIKADAIMAYIFFLDEKFDQARDLFEEAIRIAEKTKHDDLKNELTKAKWSIEMIMGDFDLITTIDVLLSQPFLLIEESEDCPICRNKKKRSEMFSGSTLVCESCGTYYHAKCLKEKANSCCPICLTTYSLDESHVEEVV